MRSKILDALLELDLETELIENNYEILDLRNMIHITTSIITTHHFGIPMHPHSMVANNGLLFCPYSMVAIKI